MDHYVTDLTVAATHSVIPGVHPLQTYIGSRVRAAVITALPLGLV